jgi:hypothetical protein
VSVTEVTNTGSKRRPSVANTAYARVRSSSVTSLLPSASEKFRGKSAGKPKIRR